MLVLASLPLPIADVETDLDRARDSLVAERWYLHHQGILVRKQRRGRSSQDLTDQKCFVLRHWHLLRQPSLATQRASDGDFRM